MMESTVRIENLEVNEEADAVEGLLSMCPEIQDSEVVVQTNASDLNDEPVTCSFCHKHFSTTGSLRRHIHSVHGQQYVELPGVKGQIKCMYDSECEASFKRNLPYRRHLFHVHGVKFEMVVKHFSSMEEFLKWKGAEEYATQSLFNKFERDYDSKQGDACMKKRSYVCHRSGKCLPKGNKKRTMKIGTYCPAKMEIYFNSEMVILKYFKTHVGHGSLNEIYKTSLKKRMQSAVRRQKKVYSGLKNEVKAKVDMFLENLEQDKFSAEFLKHILASFDSVFDPCHNSVTENLSGSSVPGQSRESSHPVIQSGANGVISENETMVLTENFSKSLADHRYVSKNVSQQSCVPHDKHLPAIVYLSKENESIRESKDRAVTSDLGIKSNMTVPAVPNLKNTIQSKTPGEHVKPNSPVIILERGNVLYGQKLKSIPSPVQSTAIFVNPVLSKAPKTRVPLNVEMKWKLYNDQKRKLNDDQKGKSNDDQKDESSNDQKGESNNDQKGKSDTDQKFSQENKREVLEALWNAYKNS